MLKCWKRHLNKCRQKIQHQQQQLLQRYTQALKTEGCGDEHNQAPEGQNQSKVTYYYQYLIAVESETDIWSIWAWINERYGQAWSSVCFCLCHLENNWAKWSRPNTLCEVCRTGWGWCYTREDIAKNAVTSKPWMSWHSQWSRLHKACKLIRSALKTLRENRSQFSGLKGLESRVRLIYDGSVTLAKLLLQQHIYELWIHLSKFFPPCYIFFHHQILTTFQGNQVILSACRLVCLTKQSQYK